MRYRVCAVMETGIESARYLQHCALPNESKPPLLPARVTPRASTPTRNASKIFPSPCLRSTWLQPAPAPPRRTHHPPSVAAV